MPFYRKENREKEIAPSGYVIVKKKTTLKMQFSRNYNVIQFPLLNSWRQNLF